jgi:DNA-binding beta-propeller fold protein YncE
MSPDGSRVYLTTESGIGVIDVLTQTISHTIPIIHSGDIKLAINPSGTALYVAPVFSSGSLGFAVYDTATSSNTMNVPVTDLGSAMAMAVSADGAYLVIEQIVPDGNGRNDFPVTKWFSLPNAQLVTTNPWTGSRDTPITPHTLLPLAFSPQ